MDNLIALPPGLFTTSNDKQDTRCGCLKTIESDFNKRYTYLQLKYTVILMKNLVSRARIPPPRVG